MTEETRCSHNNPLISLGDGANAPVLDYNLPQKSTFSLYGRISKRLPASAFNAAATKEPADNWWVRFKELSQKVVLDKLEVFERTSLDEATLIRGSELIYSNSSRKLQKSKDIKGSTKLSEVKAWDPKLIAQKVSEGLMPNLVERLSGKMTLEFIPKPKARPQIYVVEEYAVASFLGNYGAGRTVKTFSLLPGEKTTISVKTFRDSEETRTKAENILDSFSESSADEFEERLQEETGESFSKETSHSFTLTTGMSATIPINAISLGFEVGTEGNSEISTTRSNFVNNISSTMDKHVESTSAHREIEVNTTHTETVTEGEEQSTVRELENINRSRVLNFVFRQLQQEYITLTYLKDIKIMFSNGFPESTKIVDVTRLRGLLKAVLKPSEVNKAEAAILKYYCAVFNYKDERKSFLEEVTEDFGDCPWASRGEKIKYVRRRKDISDSYGNITVPGVILDAKSHIVRTESVIADALLGQGEALDCYNALLQDEAVRKTRLENDKIELGLKIVGGGETIDEQAAAFSVIFHGPEDDDSADNE